MYAFLTSKSNKKGSFLIEALLTIVIMSIGLTFIIQSFLSSFRASAQVADYAIATILLENKISNLSQIGLIADNLDEEDIFLKPFDDFRYHLKTKNINDEGKSGFLNLVDLEIVWFSGKKKHSTALTTYLSNLPK